MAEGANTMIIFYINVIVLLIFILSYIHDRRKLINGFLFLIVMFFSGLSLIQITLTTDHPVLLLIVTVIALGFVLVMSFGLFLLIIISLINARKLIKREGRKLTNLLGLFFGIGIFIWVYMNFIILQETGYSPIKTTLFIVINTIGLYILMMVTIFIVSSFIYAVYRPRLRQDYIIVLGAGLIGGRKVSPLLAKRIDRGIGLYKKQCKKKKKPPLFIMSGGRGSDEQVSEAQAMQEYALEQGIPKEHILIEEESKNTYENMKFSKQIITKRDADKKVRVVFATTNYHVFRAGIYAKKAGLKAQGIGSRTPFYFWYNAILREFVAIMAIYKKVQLAIIIFLVIVALLLSYILNNPEVVRDVITYFS